MSSDSQRVHVVRPTAERAIVGPQAQRLIPCITRETSGSPRLSAGMVVMPPETSSKIHYHHESDIVVVCVQGSAATLIGSDLEPHMHGPGEFIYVPAGVLHMAVNLSTVEVLVAVEARTDPHFNEDVVVRPELQREAEDVAAALRERFVVDATHPSEAAGGMHRSPQDSLDVVDVAMRTFTA